LAPRHSDALHVLENTTIPFFHIRLDKIFRASLILGHIYYQDPARSETVERLSRHEKLGHFWISLMSKSFLAERAHILKLLIFRFKVQTFALTFLVKGDTGNMVFRINLRCIRMLRFPIDICQPPASSPACWECGWEVARTYLMHNSTVPAGNAVFDSWTIGLALCPIPSAIESGRVQWVVWVATESITSIPFFVQVPTAFLLRI
jgi:hypothetical protein